MKKINLLILDDKEENIINLHALLKEIEYINIISSTDTNEALKICWENDISIALVDVQIPNVNGFGFVSLLKSNPKTNHIITVLITAISEDDRHLTEGLKNGAVDYLYKPLNPDITRAKVVAFANQIQLQKEIRVKNKQLEQSAQSLLIAKDEARKSKEIFLANMSHEIRTPINGITGIINMLRSTNLNADQKDWLMMLDSASKSLLVIINDILDLSKIDSGKLKIEKENFSLTNFMNNLDRAFKIRAEDQDLNFHIEANPELPNYVIFDAQRLQQIIENFISNSLKFTHQGKITLRTKVTEAQNNGYRIRFIVEDTGIGIGEDYISKVFEVFEQGDDAITKKYGGTGLGLTIVKKLTELLDGEVAAESTPGVGSKFYFEAYFQKGAEELVQKPNESYTNFKKIGAIKILIAEDNDLNAFILSNILKSWNCEVDIVKDGQHAIESVIDNEYDLVLMDTHMPIMSGFEAIKKIKNLDNHKKETPIITISASVLEHEQAEAYTVGAHDVIGKPFEPIELYNKITKIITKRRQ